MLSIKKHLLKNFLLSLFMFLYSCNQNSKTSAEHEHLLAIATQCTEDNLSNLKNIVLGDELSDKEENITDLASNTCYARWLLNKLSEK